MFVTGESNSVPQKTETLQSPVTKEFDKHLQRCGKGGGWCKFRCHTDTNLAMTFWHLPVPKGPQLMYSAISATSVSKCSEGFQHDWCQCGFSIKTWNAKCNSIPKLRCQTWIFYAMPSRLMESRGIARDPGDCGVLFVYFSVFFCWLAPQFSKQNGSHSVNLRGYSTFPVILSWGYFSPNSLVLAFWFTCSPVAFREVEGICCQQGLLSYSGSLKSRVRLRVIKFGVGRSKC